ncbi:hypothetical protein D0N87_19725 [Pseudomonas sp. ATCC 13867]|nr:hypothetical protein D0N87_19725 [Pseudomonas sp. ATCC 13867]
MSRERRWAMDGPSTRAPETSMERGNPGEAGAGCRGKRFGYFLAFEKVTRPRGRNKIYQHTPKRRGNS